jgi:hypothetical protein
MFLALSSPNIKNLVLTFKHGNARHGPLDNIFQLKNDSPYDHIQNNVFFGQGLSKVHLFKMSTKGKGSGINLVACMQLGGYKEHG